MTSDGVQNMPRRLGPGSLRARFAISIIAVVATVVVLATAVSAVLLRQSAIRQAQDDLAKRSPFVEAAVGQLYEELEAGPAGDRPLRPMLLRPVLQLLEYEDAFIVRVNSNATSSSERVEEGAQVLVPRPLLARNLPQEVFALPDGVAVSQSDAEALSRGHELEGRSGNLVYTILPIEQSDDGLVVVLAQEVSANAFGGATFLFIVVGALGLALSAVVAFWLAKRLTRSLNAFTSSVREVAAGSLDAKVAVPEDMETELADLAVSFNAMSDSLAVSKKYEQAFLLNVSHDLKTPLTSILGYAQAMTDGTVPTTEESRATAGVIMAEGQRLQRLISDLLDLARIDAKEFALHPARTEVADVVTTAVTAFLPEAKQAGLSLDLDSRPGVAIVDADRLGQVVANLVQNALKFARFRVWVTQYFEDDVAVIVVSDDGPGISPADLPNIFRRLYTSNTQTGRRLGSGLGLAIVKQLVEAMGGRVGVQSNSEAGTVFTVRLPAAP